MTQVVGEILAGVLLGPSVLGLIPGFTSTLFPSDSLDLLSLFSSVGLCFFMMFLGMEVDPSFMLAQWRTSVPIALVSLGVPFGVGAAVARALLRLEHTPAGEDDHASVAAFVGCVFAFSALPVLARILDSTRLITAPVGIQALGVAALEDTTAWCVLALIIGYSGGCSDASHAAEPTGGGGKWTAIVMATLLAAFLALLLLIVRPLLARIYTRMVQRGDDVHDLVPYLFFGLLIAAWFTEALGIVSAAIHAAVSGNDSTPPQACFRWLTSRSLSFPFCVVACFLWCLCVGLYHS